MGGVTSFVEDTVGGVVDAVGDVGQAAINVASDVFDSAGDIVSGVGSAIEDVGGGITNVMEDVGGAVMDTVQKVGDTVTGIVEDPKKLAAVAISVAFPGAGLAVGESLLGSSLAASMGATATQIIGQTVINTAINGGNVEQGLMTAGISVMTPALAKEISNAAVSQGIDKTIADAGAKVAAGTVRAAALGQDPVVAFTFGAVDQATNAIVDKAVTDAGLKKEFNSLPDAAKVAVNAAITSQLTGASASTLAANQIVQRAISSAAEEVRKQNSIVKAEGPQTNEEQIAKFLIDKNVPPTPENVTRLANEFGLKLSDIAVSGRFDAGSLPEDFVSPAAKEIISQLESSSDQQVAFVGSLPALTGAATAETQALLARLAATPAGQAALREAANTSTKVRDLIITSGIFGGAGIASFLQGASLVPPKPETIPEVDAKTNATIDRIVELTRQSYTPPVTQPKTETQFTTGTRTGTTTKPEYAVKPSDYSDTTEEVQPWQNVYNRSLEEVNPELPVTADVQRIANLLDVDVQTALQLQQNNKALYDYLVGGGEPIFKPADPETMKSTDMIVASRPGADDNVVIQKNTPVTFTTENPTSASTVLSQTQQNIGSTSGTTTSGTATSGTTTSGVTTDSVSEMIQKAIADAKASGLEGDAALQKAIDSVSASLGQTKSDFLNLIGKTEQNLKQDFAGQISGVQSQVSNVQSSLMQAIEQAKAQGLQGDAALQAGIDEVAKNVGMTKNDLLAQIGATEQSLRDLYAKGQLETSSNIAYLQKSIADKIAANEAAGLTRDQAINVAIEEVATNLTTTKESLLSQIGQTEQSLRDLYATGQADTATNIANVQKSLADQIAANEAAGLSRDAATNKAIQDVATNLGTTKEALLGQIGKTEQSLRDLYTQGQQQTQQQISSLDSATQAKFDSLTEQQKAQALELAKTSSDLSSAINSVAQQSQQQISNVQSQIQNQIQSLSQSTQSQYNNLTKAQQEEVAARVQQGQQLNTAINDVSKNVTGLGTQLGELEKQLAAQQAAEEAYRAEQARIAKEEAAKAEQRAQSARYSSMLPGLGLGLAATTQDYVEPDRHISPDFLTTKGDTKFKGLLEDFQKMVEDQPNLTDNPTTDQENKDMAPYYSYGNETPLDAILGLGGDQQTDSTDSSQNSYGQGYFAQGGMVAPLMAAQGGYTGTRHGRYAKGGASASPLVAAGGKMRVDFRKGDAVTGPGHGQSDDIPAMLADGEFVFPADVVAAIGNGSTKAGSDALYDMMHNIRAHVRSAKPKDLPPEIKSPLDFLKSKKRRA